MGSSNATVGARDSRSRRQPVKKATSSRSPDRHRTPCDNPAPCTRPTTARLVALALFALLVVAACGSTTAPSPSPSPSTAPSAPPTRATRAPSRRRRARSGRATIDAIYDAIEAQVLELRGLEPADVDARDDRRRRPWPRSRPPTSTRTTRPTTSRPTSGCTRRSACSTEDDSLRDLYLDLIDEPGRRLLPPGRRRPCTSCRAAARSTAPRRSPSPTSTTTPCRTPTSTSSATPEALARPDRRGARPGRPVRGRRHAAHVAVGSIPNLTPEEIQEVLAAGSDPEAQRRPRAHPGDPARDPAVPVQRRARLHPADPAGRRLGRRSTRSTSDLPASTEQIIHPEKYAGRRAARSRSTSPTTSPPAWATAGRSRSRTPSASSRPASGCATSGVEAERGDGRRGRLGRRPPGRSSRVPDGAGRVAMQTEWDTAADAEAFETAAGDGGQGRPVARRRSCPATAAPTRWVVVGSDDDVLGTLAGVARPGRLSRRPHIDVGRGDPQQAEGVGERDLRRPRQGQPRRRPLRLRPGRRPARRGRTRGTPSRARSRRR